MADSTSPIPDEKFSSAVEFAKKNISTIPDDHHTFKELVKKFDLALKQLGFQPRMSSQVKANFISALSNLHVNFDGNKLNELRGYMSRLLIIKCIIPSE